MDPSAVPPGNGRGVGRAAGQRGRGGNHSKRFQPYRGGWNSNRNPAAPRVKTTSLALPPECSGDLELSSTSIPEQLASFMLDSGPQRMPGWKLYFPQEDHKDGSSLDKKIKAMQSYVTRHAQSFDLHKIRSNLFCSHSVHCFTDDTLFMRDWPQFMQELNESPEQTLNCAGLALHQKILDVSDVDSSPIHSTSSTNNAKLSLQKVRLRLDGCGPCVNLRSLKVSSYGRLVTIRGTIIRASAVQYVCSWMVFRCSSCNAEQAIRQPGGCFTNPTSCREGCRSRSGFLPLLGSPFTRTEALQEIRLQESMQGAQFDSGRVPRSIEIEFTQDLVDCVCPGDDVTVTGVLKVHPQEENQRKGVASMYKMYLEANSVSSNKNAMTSRRSEFTQKDVDGISAIQAEPSPFRLLVHSLCPTIYGHEMIKAGLILGLMGGSRDDSKSESNTDRRRSEAHVLVVGDPGVGKSQMLQACANVSPRGIFVCGNSSSNAGLTVSVRHEKGSGGSLEAGALVLADQGVCCIDEFDKMASNHQALLEVMEQQTVSVAKAGVLCSLPARTCVLAAANPSGGHYDRGRSVSENLKLNPALLSRFDLVFILLDRPDAHLDSLLTAHIQALHSGTRGQASTSSGFAPSGSLSNTDSSTDGLPLNERLKLRSNEHIDALPHALMQKYIRYARKNIHPVLNDEASEELKRYYLEMRKVRKGVDSIPVTTRQLEALIRLTQARARADLSREATVDHALDVLDIVRYSMVDVLSADAAPLQMSRKTNGAGMSQATQVKRMLRVLQQRSVALNTTIFSMDDLKAIGAEAGVDGMQLGSIVDAMNIQGFLLKKGQSLYKLLVD